MASIPENKILQSLFLSAMIMLIVVSSGTAQSLNIVNVKVEGNRLSSTELILSVADLKTGEPLNSSLTQDAIKRLYGLGFFRDVSIDALETTGGINLIIRVVELPKLMGLNFQGSKTIKAKELREKLKLNIGGTISSNLIYEKKSEINKLYAEKGYFLAEVERKLSYSSDSSEVVLTYEIDEGSKIKVDKVVLTGNVRVPDDDIIGKMRNRKRGFLKSSNFDKEKYPDDKEKIIDYLHKSGYSDAYLKSDSFRIDTAVNRMIIYLDIYEGPRYYFGKTDWKGNEIFGIKELKRALKYKENRVFNQEKFDESVYEIYFLYQEKGYMHTRVIDDHKTRDTLIDITFDIVEGLPSKINLVKIIGNTKTKEKVIRRELSIKPGQVFHRSLLIRSIRDVMQLNYFGKAEPEIGDLPSGDIDLTVKVEEKPTAQISAGAGYSGQDKLVGNFGLGIPNFRGMGQNLSFSIDVGSSFNSYSLSFTEPWLFSTPTSLGTNIYSTNRRWYTDYTEGRRGGSVQLGKRLKWPDNYFRFYTMYRLEKNRLYDFSDSYLESHSDIDTLKYYMSGTEKIIGAIIRGRPISGSLLDYQKQWLTASSMQISIVRDSRDLPEFATSGSIISYAIENNGNFLGGYWNYQKHSLEISKYIPLFWKFVLAGKITYGAIATSAGDNRILESDRFSPGGTGYDGSVRGYDDGVLTPDSLTSDIITHVRYTDSTLSHSDSSFADTLYSEVRVHGKFMLIGNLELQMPIVENQIYALLFFDAGNSWLRASDMKLKDLYKGIGFGVRLVVPPIGTIGFDFGYRLDERKGEKQGWRLHPQFGTTIR